MPQRDYTVFTMHECIGVLVETRAYIVEYQTQTVPVPEWLSDQQTRMERRVRDLRHDQLAHRLAQLKGMIASKQPVEHTIATWQEEATQIETALES